MIESYSHNRVFSYVPAQPGFFIVDFTVGRTEAQILHRAEPVIAWAICQYGHATPVTASKGVDDFPSPGDSVLMYPNKRVDSGLTNCDSVHSWIKARKKWQADREAKDVSGRALASIRGKK